MASLDERYERARSALLQALSKLGEGDRLLEVYLVIEDAEGKSHPLSATREETAAVMEAAHDSDIVEQFATILHGRVETDEEFLETAAALMVADRENIVEIGLEVEDGEKQPKLTRCPGPF